LTATGLLVHDEQTVIFQFAEQEKFVIELKVNLPEESAAPEFSWSIKAKKNGWYSVGFTGIEAQNPTDLDFLYQPLVWSWKRFPSEAVLTPEAYATSAASFTTSHGLTEGIAVPSKEIPYRFANFNNSRFGIALRTKHGQAKPMIFFTYPGGRIISNADGRPVSFFQFNILYKKEIGTKALITSIENIELSQ
jgi:hypothetical protein